MNDTIRILVADDEPDIRNVLNILLTSHGYVVDEAENGLRAVEMANNCEYDLIIMDIMMPEMSGTDACARIRKASKAPVLFLTAKDQDADQSAAYNSGGDDYLVKPFSKTTLFLHVDALLRRTGGDAEELLSAGGIEINKSAHIVTIDGEPIELSFKEFELLEYFLKNPGRALSREMILNNVWNYNYYGDARTIDTHVKKLRSKMGDKGKYILTVWGLGYKFEVPTEEA